MNSNDEEDIFSISRLILTFGRKPTVLCVEDNELNAQLVSVYLEDYCLVDCASSGIEAIRLSSLKQYDLILMDIGLGAGMDGIETSKEIRQIHEYESTPIAAVTGFILAQEKDKVLSAGLDYYLGKPFQKDEILHLIQEILIKLIYSAPESYPNVPINAP
jgi:CheY-like chemotaxis protein